MATAIAVALTTGSAFAAGGPPIPLDGISPVSAASTAGGLRYATVPDGNRTTLLAISEDGGEIVDSKRIPGRYGLPAVALDGTAAGVSADATTVVVIQARGFRGSFPRRTTRMLVFKAGPHGVKGPPRPIELAGDFGFDAISPDGSRIYLVEHRSRDYQDYAVRSLDTATGRLDPRPVPLDEEDPEEMRGTPMTQVIGVGGRWVYTLYLGGHEPFIHALDTVARRSVCIDLPQLEDFRGVPALDAAADGSSLVVSAGPDGRQLAVVDTETFAVTDPAAAPAVPSTPGDDGGEGAIPAWVLGLIGTAALAAGCALWLWRSRANPADDAREARAGP